jgi:hypothetical protein
VPRMSGNDPECAAPPRGPVAAAAGPLSSLAALRRRDVANYFESRERSVRGRGNVFMRLTHGILPR